MRTNLPGALRALRYRRGWRQADLGRRSGLSRDVVSRVERGVIHGITLGSLSRLAGALDASLVVEVRWRGAELDRLIDRTHAALGNAAAERLARAGWITRAEVSFNHYGDRGRCDLVAWHPRTRTLLTVEVKSRIGDLQDTLGRLDTKARLGSVIAGQLGLGEPARVVPAFVLGEGGANRESFCGTRRCSGRSASAVALRRHGFALPSARRPVWSGSNRQIQTRCAPRGKTRRVVAALQVETRIRRSWDPRSPSAQPSHESDENRGYPRSRSRSGR